MEFWGVEVKSGVPLKVTPGSNKILHLSQASLGELKKEKGCESVLLFVNADGRKLPLGTLFTDKLPQQQFDLVFDRDFEISHNWKNGSVYLFGYKADNPFEEDEEGGSDESDPEDDILNKVIRNEEPALEPKPKKPAESEAKNASSKQKVKIEEPKKNATSKEDDEISDDDDDSMSEDFDEDDDEDSSESDEETPKKDVAASKKRGADPTAKTPVQEKKAKVSTPQKTGGHAATPHPAKQAGKKTPGEKPIPSAQKSGGAHSCTSCNRTFGTEKALESHNKAKHSVAK